VANAHADPDAFALAALAGWHPRAGFAWRFPTPDLPLVPGQRYSYGSPDFEPNRLYCGDNLHVMRALPDDSIDLIVVDPPFFSGYDYRQKNGPRSYSDIWEGGLDEYLAWLNARLYEMKRLLKPDGTLYVHLDYHAAHYVKVELDKLFGYGRMLNEIIWHMNSGQRRAHAFGPRHNVILRYSASDRPTFNADAVREPYSPDINVPASKAHYYHPDGKVADDVWRIPILSQNDRRERTGYPTQKPEALLERIIRASSNPGDVVADFFCGSGTALVAAGRLGRCWIGCDNAPDAIRVTLSRLEGQRNGGIRDVTLSYAGMAPLSRSAQADPAAFRAAVIAAYGGQIRDEGLIHGVKGREALHVGALEPQNALTEGQAVAFAEALRERGWKRGALLAGAFEPAVGARFIAPWHHAEEVRLTLVKLALTPGPAGPLLTFARPPRSRLRFRRISDLIYRFDAADSAPLNPGAHIERVEWAVEPLDGGAARVELEDGVGWKARCYFARAGRYAVVCCVRDDRGGEGLLRRGLTVTGY
jgi:DNA modification methylase